MWSKERERGGSLGNIKSEKLKEKEKFKLKS